MKGLSRNAGLAALDGDGQAVGGDEGVIAAGLERVSATAGGEDAAHLAMSAS